MRLGQNLFENIWSHTPNPRKWQELLSEVAGLYDPIGLVTPVKLKGAILVCREFQEASSNGCQMEVNMLMEQWSIH